jgi:hypothetical protein
MMQGGYQGCLLAIITGSSTYKARLQTTRESPCFMEYFLAAFYGVEMSGQRFHVRLPLGFEEQTTEVHSYATHGKHPGPSAMDRPNPARCPGNGIQLSPPVPASPMRCGSSCSARVSLLLFLLRGSVMRPKITSQVNSSHTDELSEIPTGRFAHPPFISSRGSLY